MAVKCFVRGHAVLNPRKNVCPHCGLTARAMTVEGSGRGHAVVDVRKNVCPHFGLTARAMTVEGSRADMRWRIHERTAAYDRGLTALCGVHEREGAGNGV